ncbi:MAG: hypothetical protein IJ245_06675 [Lachnospiraceae bacterium]|nr:hypothetical protein [Lachnospiraceae bacterium]
MKECRKKQEQNLLNKIFLCLIVILSLSGCSGAGELDPDDYVKLGQYKGLKVDRASYEVTEEELAQELDMLANAYAEPDGTIPELTDDFIREISGGHYKDMAAYTAALEDEMKSEYEEFYELQYYEDIWNKAVDNATVIRDFPPEYLQKKTERSIISARKYAQSLNMTFEDFVNEKMGLTVEEFNTQAIEYAKVAAKESMVLAAIAKAENITVSDEDIEKAIKEYVDLGAFESEEAFRQEGEERMEELKEYILTSKVQDFLVQNADKE